MESDGTGILVISIKSCRGKNCNCRADDTAESDPVTGSTERVVMSGASWWKDELEPLGQQLDTTAPPPPGAGGFGSEQIGSAYDPQRQCLFENAMGLDFFEMSFNCKMAHWDANPFFNPFLAEQKEERNGTNLQGGTANQSHGSNNTASSGTLDETTSTNKETEADDPEESEPVPPASDPCEGKESEFSVCTSVKETTNPPDPDVDYENNIVTVRAGQDDDVQKHFSAENGGSLVTLGPTIRQITNSVSSCINTLFGTAKRTLTVNSLAAAVSGVSDGIIGITVGTDTESAQRFSYSSFNVITDARSESGTQLAGRLNNKNRPYIAGYTHYVPNQTINYLANDTAKEGATTHSGLGGKIGVDLGIQIHELGNALATRYGQQDPPEKYWKKDRDTGMALENCVDGLIR